MQLKFCPQCGGMELGKDQAGGDKCRRCNYHGPMENGSMDRINEVRRRFRGGSSPMAAMPSQNAAEGAEPAARPAFTGNTGGLSGLIGAKSSSSSVPTNMHVPGQGPTQSEIAERLKSLKGKSTGDVEFL